MGSLSREKYNAFYSYIKQCQSWLLILIMINDAAGNGNTWATTIVIKLTSICTCSITNCS